MTDITLGKISTHGGGGALLDRAVARLRLWQRRLRERDELARLSARDLQDIGLSTSQAEFEAAKPFWRA
ncbi:MAG: DUF1127 domain-containing protein [Alphaproteobacteria bacterium]